MAISQQRLTIYLYIAHRAIIFAIAQLSCSISLHFPTWSVASDAVKTRTKSDMELLQRTEYSINLFRDTFFHSTRTCVASSTVLIRSISDNLTEMLLTAGPDPYLYIHSYTSRSIYFHPAAVLICHFYIKRVIILPVIVILKVFKVT